MRGRGEDGRREKGGRVVWAPNTLSRFDSHPQSVVDGVLLLILGHHQCEGVRPRVGQPDLGQVMRAVDADAVDVRRGVGCGGSRGSAVRLSEGRTLPSGLTLLRRRYLGSKPSSRRSCKQPG